MLVKVIRLTIGHDGWRRHQREASSSFLQTRPSFMISLRFRSGAVSTRMSSSGLPSMTRRSAYPPGATTVKNGNEWSASLPYRMHKADLVINHLAPNGGRAYYKCQSLHCGKFLTSKSISQVD